MQWFKHDTDAATDAKIRKLIMRYGTDGYAIYFHCIELIVGNVSEHNITFELEHDAEIIADNLKIQGTSDTSPVDRVNQIMKYIVSLGLFEESKGRIFCYKILKRLDSSMTSSTKMRGIITRAKQSHDKVMISHDSVMQEENRIEEKRIEQKRTEEKREETPDKPAKSQKHKHGEYKHVLLTSDEYQRLCEEWGEQEVLRMIKILDEGIETKGYKYKNHNLALRKWKANEKKGGYSKPLPVQTRTTFLDMED
jgi:hypothetical protein